MDIFEAVENNDIEAVRKYIHQVNDTDEYDETALLWASMHGHTEVCKLLLENDANVNHANEDGETALIWASHCGHTKLCKLLLENGADVNHVDKSGDTVLSLAGKKEIIELLKEYGVTLLVI